MTTGSVVFDQAAAGYDRTRALPEETARAQTDLLAAELSAMPGPVLEIGVGTGRIAVPLALTGRVIIGIDLSAPMLAELVAKGSPVVPLLATATELPARSASVAGAIACHVLHLVGDWRAAVTELTRVLRPGGILLVSMGRTSGPCRGPGPELQQRLQAAMGTAGRRSGGLESLDELDPFLRQGGASIRQLPAIANPASRTAAQFLRDVGDNTYSWTWQVPPNRLRAAVTEARAWVAQTMGDPEQVQIPSSPVLWRSYRMPDRNSG